MENVGLIFSTILLSKHVEDVRIVEHIRCSPLNKNKVNLMGSIASDHLLFCNHSLSLESFSVLTNVKREIVLKLKESFLIMRDKPSLKKSI